MSNQLNESEVEELAEALSSDAAVQTLLAGDPRIATLNGVPKAWVQVLANRAAAPAEVINLWTTLRHLLPRTIAEMEIRVLDVLLAWSDPQSCSLVYAFRLDGEVMGQRGYLPATEEELLHIPSPIRDVVENFYHVHDGWVDIYSADGGPRPRREWHSTDAGPRGTQLIAPYSNGSHFAGFEISEGVAVPYGVWPEDEEVVQLRDFWQHVDDQIASGLEDCDVLDRSDLD
jgi:hypothetical protein